MKEVELRKWHRFFGMVLALFFILQAGTGLVMTASGFGKAPETQGSSEYENQPLLTNCIITANSTTAMDGGGMYIYTSASPAITKLSQW